MRDVKDAIQKAVVNNVIDDELAELLIIDESRPGNIYFLPKIHKNVTPPPGRPICNTINTLTMNLSRWVGIQLQSLVKKLPSYISKMTTISNVKLTNSIKFTPSAQCLTGLVTWDVKSLYTNIPHKEGLEALKTTLDNEKIPTKKADTIQEFSKLVLTSPLQVPWTTVSTDVWHSYGY